MCGVWISALQRSNVYTIKQSCVFTHDVGLSSQTSIHSYSPQCEIIWPGSCPASLLLGNVLAYNWRAGRVASKSGHDASEKKKISWCWRKLCLEYSLRCLSVCVDYRNAGLKQQSWCLYCLFNDTLTSWDCKQEWQCVLLAGVRFTSNFMIWYDLIWYDMIYDKICYMMWYDVIWYEIFVNCNWVNTRWQ